MPKPKRQVKLPRLGLENTNLVYTGKRRALPNLSAMRHKNGPVKITKVGTVRKTKEERRAWWNSLSQEQQAAHTEKWEHKRDVADRQVLDIPPLTPEECREINDTMRRLGLEKHIVLPDDYYQEELASQLSWIS